MSRFEDLFFARPVVRYPGTAPAALVEAGLAHLPDDGDTGLNHWLLGQPTFAEAHATSAARDARLGFMGRHIEFVPTTWSDVEAAGCPPTSIAVGPKLGDDDFERIARLVIDASIDQLLDWESGTLIIYRTAFHIQMGSSGPSMVVTEPLYTTDIDDSAFSTADWVGDAIADACRNRGACSKIVQ